MRIIFMGSPAFALPTLAALIKAKHEIVAVYSQPPRPAHRGKKTTPCPVHAFAQEQGLTVVTPQRLSMEQRIKEFEEFKPDIAVVVAYGLILPKAILDIPRYGCINVHPSLLPRWRGASPIHRPIIAGDEVTGVTIMQMDEGCDTGPILLYQKVPIGPEETAETMTESLSQLGAELCVAAIVGLERGIVKPITQPDEGALYARKLDKDEGHLQFHKLSATKLERLIRGVQPWPGAYFNYKGERIKVLKAQVVDSNARVKPGEIATAPEISDGQLWIGCREGILQMDRLQRANRAPMDADELMRGFIFEDGDVIT